MNPYQNYPVQIFVPIRLHIHIEVYCRTSLYVGHFSRHIRHRIQCFGQNRGGFPAKGFALDEAFKHSDEEKIDSVKV